MHNGVQHAHVHHTPTHAQINVVVLFITDKKLDLIHDPLMDLPLKGPSSYFPANLFHSICLFVKKTMK